MLRYCNAVQRTATQRNVERNFYVVDTVETATTLRCEKNEDHKNVSAKACESIVSGFDGNGLKAQTQEGKQSKRGHPA